MPRKFKLYVRKNEKRLKMKSMGISSALVSPYNEVAVQTEPQAAPDRVDAEVQTNKSNHFGNSYYCTDRSTTCG